MFTVTTGRLPVKDMTGKAQGKIFYIAYIRKALEGGKGAPTFCGVSNGPNKRLSHSNL